MNDLLSKYNLVIFHEWTATSECCIEGVQLKINTEQTNCLQEFYNEKLVERFIYNQYIQATNTATTSDPTQKWQRGRRNAKV